MDSCTNCGVSFIGAPIPQAYIDKGYYGDSTHWRREIGIEVSGVYDGILIWKCPDCGHMWPRFDSSHRLYNKALEVMIENGSRL